jgi:hypothetical protein
MTQRGSATCDTVQHVTVLRLGALADGADDKEHYALNEELNDDASSVSIAIEQFAELSDGRRIVLDDQLGFSVGLRGRGRSQTWQAMKRRDVEADIRTVLLPDVDDGEAHPWQWLADRIRNHGVQASPEELKAVLYEIILSDRLLTLLAPTPPD